MVQIVIPKSRGDHSDHHHQSGANKKDTCRNTTGGEQHDVVNPAHTQMHTHSLTERSAGGKQHDLDLTFTCVEMAMILTAHL